MFYAYYTTQLYNVLHLSCTTNAVRDVVHSTFRGHWLLRLVRNGRTSHGGMIWSLWYSENYSVDLLRYKVTLREKEKLNDESMHPATPSCIYNSRNGQLQF